VIREGKNEEEEEGRKILNKEQGIKRVLCVARTYYYDCVCDCTSERKWL